MAEPIARRSFPIAGPDRLESPQPLAALAAACFEAHPDPQFIFDADVAVVGANAAARIFLDQVNGPRGLAEALVARAPEFMRAVGRAIQAAIGSGAASGALTLSLAPPLAFSVRVVPLGARFAEALLTLRLSDSASARSPRERFGFTAMESRVAELLCRRMTAAQIARELGISVETVRCHLKQAFAKAGVHRQAGLVAVLLGA
jgi:DNA-binding CsgD family transcriptional regulator